MASISSDNEVEESVKQFILEYFLQGSTYDKIVKLLSKNHGIEMSVRTLKSRLHQYKLRRRGADYDIDAVRERIQKELDGTGCLGGYRSMWHTLCSENFEVPRRIVEHLMREMDPEGCKLRQAHRLKRRKYFSRGPNDVWHVDGYDKLKPYGFPIHGCIDGWSRRMMWLRVSRTNNNPEVVASFYLDCVDQVDGCPVTLRTDCGTENGIMASMQCDFRRDVTAHKYGTSPSNQRIEGWWAFLRKNWTTWWMNFFKDLIEQDLFHPGNELEMECMWFCFNGLIQNELNKVRKQWNTHYIRASRHATVHGRPEELYCLPECHGGQDNLLVPVSEDQIESVKDMCSEVEVSLHQKYFTYVVDTAKLELPESWQEGLSLYEKLLEIAAIGLILHS